MTTSFSPAEHLGAVQRALATVDRDGVEMRRLTLDRTFAATPAEVWDALTAPERIPRWFLPVSGDLKVGGRYQFEGQAGGDILACEPPQRLSTTWEYGGDVSWLDVTLTPTDAGTLLTLEHTAPVSPETWEQFGPGAVGIGWEQGLLGLALHLSAPDAPAPDVTAPEFTAPMTELITASNQAWAEASIAAGTDPEAARAAARRCLAAYTAPPEPTPEDVTTD